MAWYSKVSAFGGVPTCRIMPLFLANTLALADYKMAV